MKTNLGLKTSQQLALTPQLQQSIKLLQMSTVELREELESTILENPLLEFEESAGSLHIENQQNTKSIEEGAATQVYVATNPNLKEVSGAFFEDCNPVNVSGDHFLFDKAMAERLWTTSEKMIESYLIDWE